jgi:hypothetical protein
MYMYIYSHIHARVLVRRTPTSRCLLAARAISAILPIHTHTDAYLQTHTHILMRRTPTSRCPSAARVTSAILHSLQACLTVAHHALFCPTLLVCIYVQVYIYVCVCVCMSLLVAVMLDISAACLVLPDAPRMYVCTGVYMYLCFQLLAVMLYSSAACLDWRNTLLVCVYMYRCIYVCIFRFAHIHICACVYVCVGEHIYIYT